METPEQPQPHMDDHQGTISRNARYGLILFVVYVVMYVGFMALSAFDREKMKTLPFGGMNLAVWYGMGLIAAALVLALMYMVLCRSQAK